MLEETTSLIALLYDDPAEYVRTIERLTKVLQANPANVAAWNNRAVAYLESERLAEAAADLDQATSLSTADFVPWLNRAQLRRQSGDLEGAIADLSRAIAVAPEESAPWTFRARLMVEAGRIEEALADFDAAVRRGNSSAIASRDKLLAK